MISYQGAALADQQPVGAWKRCTCCFKDFSRAEWERLPSLGAPMVSEEDGWIFSVQLKNCSCGSTLGAETRRRCF